MNKIGFQRMITWPLDEFKMSVHLNKKYKLRSVKESVEKLEDCKYQKLILEKQKGKELEVEKVQVYIDVLEWILNGKTAD